MIGSCELKAGVEESLGTVLDPDFFDQAEQYARRKLDMTRFACKPPETSCLLSNLFTELRPVCGRCEGDNVVLCGLTYEGEEQTVVLRDYGFDYSGRRETVERIRKRRCINGNPEKLSAEGEWE